MRALAFARALLAHWDRRVASPRPLGMVFRRSPAEVRSRSRTRSVAHTRVLRDVHVDIQPRIALTVVRPLAQFETRDVREHSSSRSVFERLGGIDRLILRNTSAIGAERVLERALSKSRRVEVLYRSAPAATLLAEGDRSRMPPPLVVQHMAARHQVEGESRPAGPREATRPALHDSARADLDLGRITDHVVTAIDNRLAAHAERLGRS